MIPLNILLDLSCIFRHEEEMDLRGRYFDNPAAATVESRSNET